MSLIIYINKQKLVSLPPSLSPDYLLYPTALFPAVTFDPLPPGKENGRVTAKKKKKNQTQRDSSEDRTHTHTHKHSKIASPLPSGEQRIMSVVHTHAHTHAQKKIKNKTQKMINGADTQQEQPVTLTQRMVRQNRRWSDGGDRHGR